MDATTEAGTLFGNDHRHKGKIAVLDLTIINPCQHGQTGKHLVNALERKKSKCRGPFPATYVFLLLAMSTCGELGSELTRRRMNHTAEPHSEVSWK